MSDLAKRMRNALAFVALILFGPPALMFATGERDVAFDVLQRRLIAGCFVAFVLAWFVASYLVISRFDLPLLGWAMVVLGITAFVVLPQVQL